jgi:hypothetical protein
VQSSPELAGIHLTADCRYALIESTFAWVYSSAESRRDTRYAAGSVTQFFGPFTLAGRGLFKWGDQEGRGDGQLYVIETNYTRTFSEACHERTGIKYGVFYANAFKATHGWNSISGGNYDRLRSTFEVNPLVMVASARPPERTIGGALGVQLFRHHEDQSFIPEFAYEEQNGEPVWGFGLGYLQKLCARAFLSVRGIRTYSDDASREREGVFCSTTVLF